ncbi:MAG: Phenylalanine-specific permease [uncultured Caballeronia sp.]|nr:MAG: Phenylalanine-specific permease [uncultured Caballeronia sp.]
MVWKCLQEVDLSFKRGSFEAVVEREKGLHRSLTAGQMSMIAIGGAISTGLF